MGIFLVETRVSRNESVQQTRLFGSVRVFLAIMLYGFLTGKSRSSRSLVGKASTTNAFFSRVFYRRGKILISSKVTTRKRAYVSSLKSYAVANKKRRHRLQRGIQNWPGFPNVPRLHVAYLYAVCLRNFENSFAQSVGSFFFVKKKRETCAKRSDIHGFIGPFSTVYSQPSPIKFKMHLCILRLF